MSNSCSTTNTSQSSWVAVLFFRYLCGDCDSPQTVTKEPSAVFLSAWCFCLKLRWSEISTRGHSIRSWRCSHLRCVKSPCAAHSVVFQWGMRCSNFMDGAAERTCNHLNFDPVWHNTPTNRISCSWFLCVFYRLAVLENETPHLAMAMVSLALLKWTRLSRTCDDLCQPVELDLICGWPIQFVLHRSHQCQWHL